MGSPRSRASCSPAVRGRASHPSRSRCCTNRRPSMYVPGVPSTGATSGRWREKSSARRSTPPWRVTGGSLWTCWCATTATCSGASPRWWTWEAAPQGPSRPRSRTTQPSRRANSGSWSSSRGTCLSTSPRPMPSSRSGNPGLLHLAFAIYIQPLKLNSDVLRCCDLVQWILHRWDDEQCARILQRWSEALPEREAGGRVIVMDLVVRSSPEDAKPPRRQGQARGVQDLRGRRLQRLQDCRTRGPMRDRGVPLITPLQKQSIVKSLCLYLS
jgi:hypothetical protein